MAGGHAMIKSGVDGLEELFDEVVRRALAVTPGEGQTLADTVMVLLERFQGVESKLVGGTVMAAMRIAAVELRNGQVDFLQQRTVLTATGLLVDAKVIDVWCLVEVFTGVLATMSENVLREHRRIVHDLVQHIFARPNPAKTMKLKIVQAFIEAMDRLHSPSLRGFLSTVLTNALPPEDQSGRNQKGRVHVENRTIYQMSFDDNTTVGFAAAESLVDWALYKAIWSLQDYSSNPPTVDQNRATVRTLVDTVLQAIDEAQRTLRPPSSWLWLNKKYLTSPHLLTREITNPIFQRQLLTQLLFVLTPLSEQTTIWKPTPDWKPTVSWKPVLDRIRELLNKTSGQRNSYVSVTREMMKRDQDWVAWKSGVPDGISSSAPVSLAGYSHKKTGKRKAFEMASKPGGKLPASLIQPTKAADPLANMWAPVETPLDTVMGPERNFVPTLDDQFNVLRDERADTMMDEESKSKGDRTFVWKLLRLARQKDFDTALAISTSNNLDNLV